MDPIADHTSRPLNRDRNISAGEGLWQPYVGLTADIHHAAVFGLQGGQKDDRYSRCLRPGLNLADEIKPRLRLASLRR